MDRWECWKELSRREVCPAFALYLDCGGGVPGVEDKGRHHYGAEHAEPGEEHSTEHHDVGCIHLAFPAGTYLIWPPGRISVIRIPKSRQIGKTFSRRLRGWHMGRPGVAVLVA